MCLCGRLEARSGARFAHAGLVRGVGRGAYGVGRVGRGLAICAAARRVPVAVVANAAANSEGGGVRQPAEADRCLGVHVGARGREEHGCRGDGVLANSGK